MIKRVGFNDFKIIEKSQINRNPINLCSINDLIVINREDVNHKRCWVRH